MPQQRPEVCPQLLPRDPRRLPHAPAVAAGLARAAPGGPAADTAADALLADAHTRLHDFAAPGLGLLQVTDDATVEWDHDADDTAYTCATLRLTVVHRTPAATLQPWS